MPSGNPPHKGTHATNEARLALSKAAFLTGPDRDRIEVSTLEIERVGLSGQPGYAFDTIQELRQKRGQGRGDRLAFVIGADQFLDLPKWHRFPEILGLCHWIVLERKLDGRATLQQALGALTGSGLLRSRPDWSWQGAHCLEITSPPGTGVLICPTPARALSSTDIREALARGAPPKSLPLSEAVIQAIHQQKLYGTRPER
jgi:nicotinate-nucleotide adenylyltransferase